MFFQEYVTDFRGASHVTMETKNLNYFMKLLNKTGWLNGKAQNIRAGQGYIPKQFICHGEMPPNLYQTLIQEHSI